MTLEQIILNVDEYLNESNQNPLELIEKIQSVQDFLSYNLRLTNLTENQKIDFVETMEGGRFTEGMNNKINDATSESKKDYYIEMYARSNYFRKCAWLSYLHGETTDCPNT